MQINGKRYPGDNSIYMNYDVMICMTIPANSCNSFCSEEREILKEDKTEESLKILQGIL